MRASRLISLLLMLQSRDSMTAAELARELGVSERTVYRDAMALSEAGIPVYADRGRTGGYKLVGGYRTRLTGLSRDEAEALFLSGVSGPLREMGLADSLAAAQLKVSAALPAPLRDAATRSAQRFLLDAPGWFQDADTPALLAPLARAVWADRVVATGYRRGGDVVARTLQPFGLVLKSGVWYLLALVGTGSLRSYRVDRFAEVELSPETFERPADFDLAAVWAERSAEFARTILTTTITIRLTAAGLRSLPHVADRAAAEEILAATPAPDADGWTTVELLVESVGVAYSQVLGFGPEAEVLDPPELRALIADAAARLHALYP